MIIDTIILYSYLLLCFISIIGYGLLTLKFLKIEIDFFNIGETALLGFFLIFALSLIIHLFIPIYQYLNLFIILIGILYFVFSFKKIKNKILLKNYFYYLIFITLIPSIIVIRTHADYEWYHLPYINYLNNFKIIFGLANLSNNLSFGHGWQDILAIFSIPILTTKGLTALGMIFYFSYLLTLIKYIEEEKYQGNKIIIFAILIFSLSTFNKLIDFGAEAQPLMLMILFALNCIFITKDKNNKLIIKILFYFIFSLLLRVGSVIFLPTFLIVIALNFKLSINCINKNFRPLILTTFILFLLLARNFIHSGCIIFPIPSTCIDSDTIKWSVPIENTEERYYVQSSKAKGYEFYIKANGNNEHINFYHEKIKNKQIEHPKVYSKNIFIWSKYWILDHDTERIINILIIISISFILLLLSKKEKFIYLKNNEQIILLISFFLSTCFWFYTSPQTRYGGVAIISITYLYLLYFLFFRFRLDQKKFKSFSNLLVFLPLIYISIKNIDRISNFELSDFKKFPFPNYNEYKINKDYEIYSINGFNLNLKMHTPGEVYGEPIRCGNIKMICIPEPLKVCINNIEIINNYIFVSNTGSKCLEQYKKNYWQH